MARSPELDLTVLRVRLLAVLRARLLTAYTPEHNQRATFAAHVADLEQICRRDLPALDAESATREELVDAVRRLPAEYSPAWFAREILAEIAVVRELLAQGQGDSAASAAFDAGVLAAHAGNRYETFQFGIKSRHAGRTAGLASGAETHEDTLKLHDRIRYWTRQYTSSDNVNISLVAFLAERVELQPRTLRRHLKRLNIPLR